MKYILYLILLYILLPLNNIADFIAIFLFFITITESAYFAIVCAFIGGLLIDLYYPSMLGLNVLILLVLVQALLSIKKYVAQTLITTSGLFTVFFLMRVTVQHVVIAFDLSILYVIITIAVFFPIYVIVTRTIRRLWMRA
jgi:rod shape-determining protein MreD